MSYNAGAVVTQIKGDLRNFSANFKKAKGELKDFGEEAKRQQQNLRLIGGVLTGIATIAGVVGFKFAKMASDANETQTRFDHIFEGMEHRANKWAESFADDFNQVTSEVKDWVSGLQDTFVPMGIATEQAWDMSRALTELAVDASSFYNKNTVDVLRDIQSAMTGQHETVKKYAVIITEARMKQYALNQGWIREGEQLTENQKLMARYQLLFEGMAKAQGDYKRTQDSFANQLRETRNLLVEIGQELGQHTVPTFQTLLGIGKDLLTWFKELPPEMKRNITQLGMLTAGFAGVAGPLMIILSLLPQLKLGLIALKTSFAPFFVTGVVVAGLIAVLNRLMNIRREMNLIAKDSDEIATRAEAEEKLAAIEAEIKRQKEKYESPSGRLGISQQTINRGIPFEETEAYKNLQAEKQATKELIAEFDKREKLLEEEQKILEEMRTKRSQMLAGDITEEEYTQFLQSQIDAEKWSADIRAQMVMELESIKLKSESTITDDLESNLKERERLLTEYQNKMELLHLEGYQKTLKQIEQQRADAIAEAEAEMEEALAGSGYEEGSAEYNKIKREWEKTIKTIGNYWDELYVQELKNAKNEALAIEKNFQNQLKLIGKEGLDYELELLRQEKEAMLEQYKNAPEAFDEINKLYGAKEQEIRDKYAKEARDEQLAKDEAALQEIFNAYLENKEKTIQEWQDEYNTKVRLTEDLTDQVNELTMNRYEFQKYMIDQEYQYYAQYVEDKALLDQWYLEKLKKLEEEHYREQTENARKTRKEREAAIDEGFALASNEFIMMLFQMGYGIDEAKDAFDDFKQGVVDGLTDAIMKGKDFLQVLSNIADQIAQMIIQKGIVQPAVDWIFSSFGFAHQGAYVGPNGLQPLRLHQGVLDLQPDEIPAILQRGESVLTEEQLAKVASMGNKQVQILIQAMDSQDVMRALTKDGGEAVARAFGANWQSNGIARKIVKGGD